MRLPRPAALLMLGLGLGLGAACSSDQSKCSATGQCLPGYYCLEDHCVICESGQCTPPLQYGVGPRGAVVCGADDVCLRVPEGALTTPVQIEITRLESPTPPEGLRLLSGVYAIAPAATALAKPALLEIPISSTVAPDQIGAYQADDPAGPWTRVTGTATPITASGELDHLTYVTAGYPQ